jgi:VWFA-related protein
VIARDRVRAFVFLALASSVPALPVPDSPAPVPLAPGVQREQVNLILIDVVVTDRKGRPVEDLQPGEFSLRVDGHPQTIHSVELRRAVEGPAGSPVPSREADRSLQAVAAYSVQSPRQFVFFLDGLNSERGLGPRPIQAVRTFLQSSLLPGDEVMMVGLGKELKVYLEFTSERTRMLKALEEIEGDPAIRIAGENRAVSNMQKLQEAQDLCVGCSDMTKMQAAQRLAVVFADEDRRRILRTLAAVSGVVAALNSGTGRKELFYLTDGFPADPDSLYGSPGDPRIQGYASQSPSAVSSSGGAARSVPGFGGIDASADLLRIAREAGSTQVAIHTVNTQGMPHGVSMNLKATSGRPPGEIIESSASNALATFALGTGGIATRGTDDFLAALERVEREARATYVVSYLPAGNPDGLFHSTRVEVHRKGVQVRAKDGFLWLTEEQIHERQLFAAFVSPELYHDFPVALETLAFLGQGGQPAVEFAIAVPDEMLLFLPSAGHFTARLEAGLALRKGASEIADQFSRSVDVRLEAREMAAHSQLTLLGLRDVPPGDYEAVVVVRDLGTGNIGAVRSRLQVPALARDRMAVSSLALVTPGEEGARVDLDPATRGSQDLLVPRVPRVLRRDSSVEATCRIYHPQRKEQTGEAVIQVQGTLRKGGETARTFPPVVHVFTGDHPSEAIPLKIPISLEDLAPGVYSLQVQVLDQVGKQGVSQSVDFMVR